MRKDDFLPVIIIGFIFIAFFGLCMWGIQASCASQADKMGFQYSWGPLQACMIRVDDRWEPINWQRSIRIKP